MTVYIHLHHKRMHPYSRPFHSVTGSTMGKAIANAARYAAYQELAGEGPDAEVYGYDSLGGLRFEIRRRDNLLHMRRT